MRQMACSTAALYESRVIRPEGIDCRQFSSRTAVSGHFPTTRFHGPISVGSPVWPVLAGAWRPGGRNSGKLPGSRRSSRNPGRSLPRMGPFGRTLRRSEQSQELRNTPQLDAFGLPKLWSMVGSMRAPLRSAPPAKLYSASMRQIDVALSSAVLSDPVTTLDRFIVALAQPRKESKVLPTLEPYLRRLNAQAEGAIKLFMQLRPRRLTRPSRLWN